MNTEIAAYYLQKAEYSATTKHICVNTFDFTMILWTTQFSHISARIGLRDHIYAYCREPVKRKKWSVERTSCTMSGNKYMRYYQTVSTYGLLWYKPIFRLLRKGAVEIS